MEQAEATADGGGPHRLALLASALAGRTVAVADGERGERAWTDGVTIFLDGAATPSEQLQSVAVQACLLAGGSLDPALVRKLVRRTGLARRYLTIEGQRALSANDELLPRSVRRLIDFETATRSASPEASLALAAEDTGIADPPASFGAIKARRLLATPTSHTEAHTAHVPRKEARKELAELDEAAEDGQDVMDPFSSPVGGGGVAGKLLQRLMSRVRQLSGGGPPGADTPTHRSAKGIRGSGAVTSVAAALSDSVDAGDNGTGGHSYPEWDVHRKRYRRDWCTVHEIEPLADGLRALPRPDVHALRRPLTRLGIGLDRHHRQSQGDDIDVDAAVEARVELLAGSAPAEAVYVDSLRRRRDLAVLVLLDVSGSAGEVGTFGENIHQQQRAAAAALTIALHELGDRVALYAFRSQGRASVNLLPVKRFDDPMNAQVMQRLQGLQPGAYSRLGAAIRHGTSVIAGKAGTKRRLLVVLSDGLAYDHGYERVYGAADARRALAEARRQGIGCLCLTIGAATDTGELRKVFGSAAHASIPKPRQLAEVIGPLFRAALRTADLRRAA
ncbi:VWA domain-containing protein [Mycobacterium sp. IS-3022]|uniref:nitric oxide reductase activation protein NorD n=1 Tax=Mycobacterium sp. IS-3022 TaxID=1772277 RepID=UPI000741739D|nr:VWA domain-containing protein [Mycobacterium sp. IS-3022]KUH99030.1 nitric oxide reductase activation protein [Mycobacterium sp. IS-3022]